MGKTLIVFCGKYDDGSAGAKRVRQFALGLRSAGDEACVIGYRRGAGFTDTTVGWKADGWGVAHASVPVANGSLGNPRVLRDAVTLSVRLAEVALAACRQRGFTRVLLYGTTWLRMRVVVKRCREVGLPVVADFNEWFMCRRSLFSVWLDQELFRRFCVPSLAGLVGIARFWEPYARRVDKPMLLIPAMADDEFADLRTSDAEIFNLVYVGGLFRRDLPETMLAGVRRALERGCVFKFIILGRPGSFPECSKTLRRIDADPILRNHVEVTGWVPRPRLRQIYEAAGAFLLLRGDDWESRACSATRLPEFLSTGRPVITSQTQDTDAYLRHQQSAWLLPLGHAPEDLADGICYLSAQREKGAKIGHAGRELVKSKLSYLSHGVHLKKFLDRL